MGDRFRIGRRGPMEPSEDLDFTTSLHDGWVVAFLLTCAPLGRAVVNFGDDESSDLTSNSDQSIAQMLKFGVAGILSVTRVPILLNIFIQYVQIIEGHHRQEE